MDNISTGVSDIRRLLWIFHENHVGHLPSEQQIIATYPGDASEAAVRLISSFFRQSCHYTLGSRLVCTERRVVFERFALTELINESRALISILTRTLNSEQLAEVIISYTEYAILHFLLQYPQRVIYTL